MFVLLFQYSAISRVTHHSCEHFDSLANRFATSNDAGARHLCSHQRKTATRARKTHITSPDHSKSGDSFGPVCFQNRMQPLERWSKAVRRRKTPHCKVLVSGAWLFTFPARYEMAIRICF